MTVIHDEEASPVSGLASSSLVAQSPMPSPGLAHQSSSVSDVDMVEVEVTGVCVDAARVLDIKPGAVCKNCGQRLLAGEMVQSFGDELWHGGDCTIVREGLAAAAKIGPALPTAPAKQKADMKKERLFKAAANKERNLLRVLKKPAKAREPATHAVDLTEDPGAAMKRWNELGKTLRRAGTCEGRGYAVRYEPRKSSKTSWANPKHQVICRIKQGIKEFSKVFSFCFDETGFEPHLQFEAQ